MNIPYITAKICELSYLNESKNSHFPHTQKILSQLKQMDIRFTKVHGFNINGSQAVIVEHHNYNVLCFRGSDQTSDWVKNARFISTKDFGYSLHRGFKEAVDDLYSMVRNRLYSVGHRKPLYITGHSLGGAMAVICAMRFSEPCIKFAGLYTFGQPRVFKNGSAQKFGRVVKGKYFRYENNNDAVPHLPPWFLNYKHTGNLRYIDVSGRVHNRYSLFRSIFDHSAGIIRGLFERGVDFSQDHAIEKYVEAAK